MSTKIEVTDQDIREGEAAHKRREPRTQTCPIALACRRIWPHAIVGLTIILKAGVCVINPIYLPTEAIKFIDDNDSGRPVQPFSFEV